METRMLLAVLAISFAGLGAYLLIRYLLDWRRKRSIRRRTWSDAGEGGAIRSMLWRARNGVRLFKPLARRALRIPRIRGLIDEAVELVALRGVVTTPEAIGSDCIAAGVALFVGGSLVAGTPVCGLALDACLAIGLVAAMKKMRDAHTGAMRDAVPDALRALSVCFKSGLTLQQTMQRVADEIQGPLSEVFKGAALRMKTGCSTGESLAVFRGRESIRELSFVAVALDVQHVSGGSIAGVLDSARESVQSEIDLRRSLKIQTAQAQLSARIVTLMPFVLIALFSLISEDFLAPFFESFAGMALLLIALLMQFAGVCAVRSMLKVDGV